MFKKGTPGPFYFSFLNFLNNNNYIYPTIHSIVGCRERTETLVTVRKVLVTAVRGSVLFLGFHSGFLGERWRIK